MQGQSERRGDLCRYFGGAVGLAAGAVMGLHHIFQALQAGAAFGLIAVRTGAIDIGHGGAAICIG